MLQKLQACSKHMFAFEALEGQLNLTEAKTKAAGHGHPECHGHEYETESMTGASDMRVEITM